MIIDVIPVITQRSTVRHCSQMGLWTAQEVEEQQLQDLMGKTTIANQPNILVQLLCNTPLWPYSVSNRIDHFTTHRLFYFDEDAMFNLPKKLHNTMSTTNLRR